MIFITDENLIIRTLRLRRTNPVGEYIFFLHYGMGNQYYSIPVEDTGDENVMEFIIPSSFTSTLSSGEYAYSIVADSQVVTSGMARKREVNFPSDTVYTGTVDSGNRYTVLISAPVGGFLYVDGERYQTYRESVTEGREILVQAVPDEHHTFNQWSDGETENPRTVVVNNDITLAASFEAAEYTVSISAGSNGSVSVNGVVGDYTATLAYGTVLTIEAEADTDYEFGQWSDGNTDNPRTVTVTGPVALAAAFQEATQYFSVSISAGQNGTVSVNGTPGDYSQSVAEGTVLTIQAIPNTGYNFTSWSDGNTDNPRTITVAGDIALASSYEEATQFYQVTVTAGQNGTVSVNGVAGNYSQTVIEGTVLTLEATPSTGYSFTAWSDGNTDNPRTLVVNSAISLTSVYEAQTQYFSVNISAGANGSVSVNGVAGDYSQSVAEGTVLTLEATPSTGYDFTAWSDGNTDNPRTLTVTVPVSLTSTYAAETYTVSIASEDTDEGNVIVNGVTGDYSQTVSYGTQIALSVSPAQHYDFVMWSDGVIAETRTVTVTGPLTLTAVFAINTYNVSISAGQNGTVTVNGVTGGYQATVPYNTQLTVSATANTGYNFNQWSDGSSTASRTLTVTSDITLSASFQIQTFQVSITAGQNGSVSVNGTPGNYSQTVNYGTVLTLEATPSTGYSFTAWSDGNTSNPRTLTVTAPVSLTSAFQAQAQPSGLNTIRYTATNGQANSTWLTAYDSDNNVLTPTETTTYGRIVFSEPVYKIVVNTDNASNIESITTSYKTEVVAYSGTSNLSNCTSLTLKSPHMTSIDFTPFTALQNIESWYANNDATISGLSNLPASGTCLTRTDNNLWEYSDLSGWTFQALGTVIAYEAEEQMDLEYHHVHNRVSYDIQPASHTFSDGVGTITYDETVGELSDNWEGCDKLYLPDTVGYFNMCEALPQAMEVGEYFGVVGGSMDAGKDWNYTQLFNNGIQPDCAVTVCQDNPILTIGTDGCLYYKEDWTGLNVVNQTVTNSTIALLDMDDRCVDASTCMFNGINGRCPFTITRLVLGDSCESLRLYPLSGWDPGCLNINEIVLNDTLQMFSHGGERISHASGGSNNPYLNVTNSGYAIESEDGTTLYWCGSNQADLSGYTHFAEGCCARLSFSSMPDISSATQVDKYTFYNVSGLSTWVWPDNGITFNGGVCVDSSHITRMEFGNRSVSFNNADLGGYAGQFSLPRLATVVFNSQLAPTQDEHNKQVFCDIPTVGTVYIPLGADYSTFLNYPGNVNNIGQWTVKYIMDNTQLAIKHTPGVTITAPTLTGLTMVASADSNGWLKVTYSGDITAYDSTDLQNNTDVLEIVLPDTCLSVGNGAFLGCSNLAKVTVGDSCTSIGNSAFYGTAITEFSAKGVTSFGSGAFGGCTSLVSVEFGENLATLGNGLFYNCSSLEYVGFDGATGPTITNNDLGSGIHATGTIYIPRYANDASFADFIADMPVGWTVIRRKQNQILYQTTDGQQINAPSEINGSPLIKHIYFNGWGVIEYAGTRLHQIPEYGFSNNSNLSALYIPSIAVNIGSNAFENCDNLTTVEIQDCTDIDWNVFNASPIVNGPDTGKLTLPPSVGYIWGGAFASLESSVIEFGPALHSIDADTFNLQNATDVYVYTTRTMDDRGNPFMNTPATGTLYMVPGADTAYWTQYLPGWTVYTSLSVVKYTSTDRNKVEPLASAFKNQNSTVVPLVYNYYHPDIGGILTFNGTLAKLEAGAFSNTNVATVELPNTVTDFQRNVFANTNLTDIKINNGPNGSTSLASDTFYTKYSGTEQHGLFKVSRSGNDRVDHLWVGTTRTVMGSHVFTIGSAAYKGNTALESCRIGKCITTIQSGAFMDCSNLDKLYLYHTVYASDIASDAFSGVASAGTLYGSSDTSVDYTDILAKLPSGWTLSQS